MEKKYLVPIKELYSNYLQYCNQGMLHFLHTSTAYHEVSRNGAIYTIRNPHSGKQTTLPGNTLVLVVYS